LIAAISGYSYSSPSASWLNLKNTRDIFLQSFIKYYTLEIGKVQAWTLNLNPKSNKLIFQAKLISQQPFCDLIFCPEKKAARFLQQFVICIANNQKQNSVVNN